MIKSCELLHLGDCNVVRIELQGKCMHFFQHFVRVCVSVGYFSVKGKQMSTFKQLTPCFSNLSHGNPFCLLLSGDYRYLRFRSISVFTVTKTAG